MSVEAVTNDLIQFKKAEMPKLNGGHNTILREQISSKQESLKAEEQTRGQLQTQAQNQSQKYDSVMAEKAVENANNRVKVTRTNAKFKFDKDINRITITITDQDNEVIREIPPESTQKMLERIHTFSGMMMDQEV